MTRKASPMSAEASMPSIGCSFTQESIRSQLRSSSLQGLPRSQRGPLGRTTPEQIAIPVTLARVAGGRNCEGNVTSTAAGGLLLVPDGSDDLLLIRKRKLD